MDTGGSCGDYMKNMGKSLSAGMAVQISNWGDSWNTMKWLDADTGCHGDCSGSPASIYSNIQVTTGNIQPAMDWGNACKNKNDGLCGDSCNDCVWSCPSPHNPNWSGPGCNCRCKPGAEKNPFADLLQ